MLVLVSAQMGCQSWRSGARVKHEKAIRNQTDSMVAAECALAHAAQLEEQGNPQCLEFYYQSATAIWPDVELKIIQCGKPTGRAAEIYQNAITKLIVVGQKQKRFHPSEGLRLQIDSRPVTIPIAYHGFPWRPEDFDCLQPVCETKSKDLKTWYRCNGLGVPFIAFHHRRPCEKFRAEKQPFPATLVLYPTPVKQNDTNGIAPPNGPRQFGFALADPLRVSRLKLEKTEAEIARDQSSSLAYRLSNDPKNAFESFVQPGNNESSQGLYMIEPYQPGKIPVVFVHGLLSSPTTWANAANEMRARTDLMARYQIWAFDYPTGEPFLSSAASLRHQLRQIQLYLDPTCQDPAMSQMVVVGHSMGGLVSKLLVTHSGTELWDSVSCRPFDEVKMTPEVRSDLAPSFFFEPTPMVRRVVFMGTPHRGSPWARRPIGRIGAKLVEEPSEWTAQHRRLVEENPNVFSEEFERRIPTSIDLLKPKSPLLAGINRLPFSQHVKLHSIIGCGYWMCGAGDSDRVVPVSSARLTQVESEKRVRAKHGQVNETAKAVDEMFAIFREHVRQWDAQQTNNRPAGDESTDSDKNKEGRLPAKNDAQARISDWNRTDLQSFDIEDDELHDETWNVSPRNGSSKGLLIHPASNHGWNARSRKRPNNDQILQHPN